MPRRAFRLLQHRRSNLRRSNLEMRIRAAWVQVRPYQRKDSFMNKGTVKFYNDQKGFGFIQPDDGGKDVFVHATALERAGLFALREGQKVAFDTQSDPRSGKTAVGNIQVA